MKQVWRCCRNKESMLFTKSIINTGGDDCNDPFKMGEHYKQYADKQGCPLCTCCRDLPSVHDRDGDR